MEQASGVHERRAVSPGHEGASVTDRNGAFGHEALLHAGDDEFARAAANLIADARSAGEPVLVAVRGDRQRLLQEVLGEDAGEVLLSDIETVGRNPACLIPAWMRFLEQDAREGDSALVLAEPVWPGRDAAELSECRRYEALLNLAFGEGCAWRMVCAYDIEALDEETVELAGSTHPLQSREGRSEASATYAGLDAVNPLDGSLPDPPAGARVLPFTIASLHEVREFVTESAHSVRLSPRRTENLRLAVNEVASNSVRHGGGAGTLRIWREERTLVCDVGDHGHIVEPLAGILRPSPDQQSGRGLWLVNHLCDLVQIRSHGSGTVVRVRMRLGGDGVDDRA